MLVSSHHAVVVVVVVVDNDDNDDYDDVVHYSILCHYYYYYCDCLQMFVTMCCNCWRLVPFFPVAFPVSIVVVVVVDDANVVDAVVHVVDYYSNLKRMKHNRPFRSLEQHPMIAPVAVSNDDVDDMIVDNVVVLRQMMLLLVL